MDTGGALIFPETSFDMSETTGLREWVDELKTFGAEGSPEGKPVWGLKEAQFTEVYEALTPAVTTSSEGVPLLDALRTLNLTSDYPIRIHSTAQTLARPERAGSHTPP